MSDCGPSEQWSLPCGCTYQPGTDLPVWECEQHEGDPDFAHARARSEQP